MQPLYRRLLIHHLFNPKLFRCECRIAGSLIPKTAFLSYNSILIQGSKRLNNSTASILPCFDEVIAQIMALIGDKL